MAAVMLEKEKEEKKHEREATLNDKVPALQLSGLSMQDLQVCAGHSMSTQTYYTQHGSHAPHASIPLIDAMHAPCSHAVGALEVLSP